MGGGNSGKNIGGIIGGENRGGEGTIGEVEGE